MSVLAEARRGAKFGATITAAVVAVGLVLQFLVVLGIATYRWFARGIPPWEGYGPLDIAKAAGGVVIAIGLFTLYAAVVGAVVMGLIALARKLWQRIRSGRTTVSS